ncbi:tRNA(His) guanylyltransferase Thg1 family protein [Curtobacterium sp. MCSS17_016]|uniref:tRNA(His) guanylyltransferase Thg1 family protein n=1 Tax=Curtobacterium sp. MCSS17_016 TaxID=2175644 RepID=UPI000DAAC0A1|nr:tRNA(His) guanylyltransferase Thg1 family protein [Curtobacterium sp. MCSS17_016]WIE81104.1 tRNA(His) guanylyltransferase Thg1 family protein [Curtobacterium sp. MCSS17_016]
MQPTAATPAPDEEYGSTFKDLERQHRTYLPKEQYAVIRLDGRAFRTYTRGLNKPYDEQFMADMDAAARAVATALHGVRLTYVQSDEISVIITAWDPTRDPDEARRGQLMFGGAVQKLITIAASVCSVEFNRRRPDGGTALFDARAFSLDSPANVRDYLSWRQADARRNTLSMLARTKFSAKQLNALGTREQHELLLGIGVDPADLPVGFTQGRILIPGTEPGTTTFTHERTHETQTVTYERSVLNLSDAPDFRTAGADLIPEPPRTR